MQTIWSKFLALNACIESEHLSSTEVSQLASNGYISSSRRSILHLACMHWCPTFRISENTWSDQFLYSTGHYDQYMHYFTVTQALQQLLLKQNRLEHLTDNSYACSTKSARCVNSKDTTNMCKYFFQPLSLNFFTR